MPRKSEQAQWDEPDAVVATNMQNRRDVLRWLLGGAIMAFSGCSIPNAWKPRPTCREAQNVDGLTIDMHCHLMNARDVNPAAFINRRVSNLDEGNVAGLLKTIGGWLGTPFAKWNAESIQDENAWIAIASHRTELQRGLQEFCDMAIDAQDGWMFPSNDKQDKGMLRNRTRNAARMLEIFPEIDLFTPSMVDLYEGNSKAPSDQFVQAQYYKNLHIASQGRFVPLISFSPERAYVEREWTNSEGYKRPMDLVRHCVEELGFIGIKVHPSSGFAPVNNRRYACPNTRMQVAPDPAEWEKQTSFYDYAMGELFDYCRSTDIPILTHNSTGIDAHEACMHRDSDPLHWTNSPAQWAEAIEKKNVRVCLAHFADGFNKDTVKPTVWLQYAAERIQDLQGMYLDLSHPEEIISPDGNGIRGEFHKAFVDLLQQHPRLGKKLMYGSDWHMPEVAKLGGHYHTIIKNLIPQEYKSSVMGMTAVEFFGLRKERATRQRLEDFYAHNNVPLENVPWLRKLKGIEQD